MLAENGHSNGRSQEAIEITDCSSERSKQIRKTMRIALAAVVFNQAVSRDGETTPQSASSIISTSKDSLSIVFVKDHRFDQDDYVRSRNSQLKEANSLLEVFGKQPLPAYTSQDRKEI